MRWRAWHFPRRGNAARVRCGVWVGQPPGAQTVPQGLETAQNAAKTQGRGDLFPNAESPTASDVTRCAGSSRDPEKEIRTQTPANFFAREAARVSAQRETRWTRQERLTSVVIVPVRFPNYINTSLLVDS